MPICLQKDGQIQVVYLLYILEGHYVDSVYENRLPITDWISRILFVTVMCEVHNMGHHTEGKFHPNQVVFTMSFFV